MGLFDNFKRQNAIQVNEVGTQRNYQCGWEGLYTFKTKGRNFGELYLNATLNQLYNGLSNVTFEPTKNFEKVSVRSICAFLENNANLLLNQYLFRGYIVVRYNKDYHYTIVTDGVSFDSFGRVINRDCVAYYSPTWQNLKKAPFELCKPILETLNNLSNTLLGTTETMGVLPIISGDSIPANPKFKQNLDNAMRKNYGYGEDQLRYFLAQSPLTVQTVDLKIKELELRENILSNFKTLLNYFEVPTDLVIGNATYANVESAKVYFYDTTVRKYAEILLKVGQALLTATPDYITKNTLTYHIYNVGGIEKTLSDMASEKGAYVDLLKKLQDMGVDVGEELVSVYQDIKRLYKEV